MGSHISKGGECLLWGHDGSFHSALWETSKMPLSAGERDPSSPFSSPRCDFRSHLIYQVLWGRCPGPLSSSGAYGNMGDAKRKNCKLQH